MQFKIMKKGILYIVATPIGNMDDITLRALDVLRNVNWVVAEDTRVTRNLLDRHGIPAKKMLHYNDYSSEREHRRIVDIISEGQDVALVSDAGTPLISDPGYKLIMEVIKNHIEIKSVPGACSLILAVTLAGLPTDKVLFYGFLSSNANKRKQELAKIQALNTTLVFFESARRLLDMLKDAQRVLGNRKIAVTRELTKVYEEVRRGSIGELLEYYSNVGVKGELVIVIEGNGVDETANINDDTIVQILVILIKNKNYSVKDAVQEICSIYNLPKNRVYKLAIHL
ncbi:Ribosomal RNA small subunit methyltransferase I [Alphaproteobacteria bacterium]